ncbi:DegT/DnrJ/EryC1/StrS aminotransferase domain protein [Leptospira mayottensis 200901122]|uniref:DegT/DnrJ/EryC1/StrS aminotransferase domain protein n=1 Tax=Leptospira mayottensis 200901122 TaxID=1193010 RepID=A0AA87MPM1_9LEPT|nr:DegT/DnrJ/EryC1/StrS aminotransferase domain protein [Leptospira mayottensis 200901122]
MEEEFTFFIGVKHSIGVANGRDAIEIAFRFLGVGSRGCDYGFLYRCRDRCSKAHIRGYLKNS